MVCIYCNGETSVANSRHQKKLNQVWRRRKCQRCGAIFSTLEMAEMTSALRFRKDKHLEAFSREKLFISVYDSLRHRKSALEDATALTATITSRLYPFIQDATIDRETIAEITTTVLDRFDSVAATYYRAYHPPSAKT